MAAKLSEAQNVVIGGVAAFIEAILLQPTLYWKNAAMQVVVLQYLQFEQCCTALHIVHCRACRSHSTCGCCTAGRGPLC
jgi:hypothetical protein